MFDQETGGLSRRSFMGGTLATAAALALAGGAQTAFAKKKAEQASDDAKDAEAQAAGDAKNTETQATKSAGASEPDTDTTGAISGTTFNYYLSNPTGIEPFDTGENQGVEVACQLFDTLVAWDWGNQTVIPRAAESWEISDDASEFIFHLRHDATFHNGKPVTAQDFKYAWERICRADFAPAPSSQGYKLANVKGAEEMMAGLASEMEGIECLDDYTLKVTLTAPYGDFLIICTDVSTAPVPYGCTDTQEDYYAFHKAPIGNGPFQMDGEWVDGQYIILAPYEGYWGDQPFLDRVVFAIYADDQTAWNEFQAGSLDFTVVPSGMFSLARQIYGEASADGYLANPGQQYFGGDELSVFYVLINNNDEIMSNRDLRIALSYAIDRQAICDVIFQGSRTPADNILMPGLAAYEKGGWDHCPPTADREKAGQYFDAAGYPLGDKGRRDLSLTLTVNSGSSNEDVMQMIQADLDACGVSASIQVQEWAAYLDVCSSGDFQIGRQGWVLSAPNAHSVLNDLFRSGFANNYSNYANPDFDAAITAACQIADDDARNAAYRAANAIVAADFPVIPLLYYSHFYVAGSRVHNMFLNPGGICRLTRCWTEN